MKAVICVLRYLHRASRPVDPLLDISIHEWTSASSRGIWMLRFFLKYIVFKTIFHYYFSPSAMSWDRFKTIIYVHGEAFCLHSSCIVVHSRGIRLRAVLQTSILNCEQHLLHQPSSRQIFSQFPYYCTHSGNDENVHCNVQQSLKMIYNYFAHGNCTKCCRYAVDLDIISPCQDYVTGIVQNCNNLSTMQDNFISSCTAQSFGTRH